MTSILGAIVDSWWIFALRGVAAVLFGVLAVLWPGLTLAVLVIMWGAFALVDGVAAVVNGIQARWWSVVVIGLVGIAAGAYALFQPGLTGLALLFAIAVWAIARGIMEVIAAIALRKEISNEWLLILSGLVSIAFGALMVAFPGAGALAVIWMIAFQAMAAGILIFVLAFRLRGLRRARS